jgi:hypothetical protein
MPTLRPSGSSRSTAVSANVLNIAQLFLRRTISYSGAGGAPDFDQVGLDNILVGVAAIPEPGTWLLGGLICGVAGFTGRTGLSESAGSVDIGPW